MSESQQSGEDVFAAERRLDEIAGYALLGGAALSFVLVCTGVVALMVTAKQSTLPAIPIPQVFHLVFRLQPSGILSLGVLVLMATPLLRVLIAMFGFAKLKWWRFAAVCAVVLTLLLLSFFVAA